MKKRIFMLLLTMTVLLGALTLTVSAAESGTCGENLTWTLNSEGTLTISGTGTMENYGWREAPWYSLRNSIVSVVVEKGVTSIGDYAFYGCTSLSSLTLPDSLISIGIWAFQHSNLSSIAIPKSVTSIAPSAFLGCGNLDSIWVENGNSNYSNDDYGVLFDKSKTQLIQAPGGISGAYFVPVGVTSIGYDAFSGCNNLNSITLSDSVTTIGYDAFSGCGSLSSIAIPKSVTSIGDAAFTDCDSLEKVEITDIAAWCQISFGENYSNPLCYASNGLYMNGEPITEAVLPDGVTSIPEYAFQNCKNLSSITIPDSVKFINFSAFANCDSLSSITIPSSVILINGCAFQSCDNLSSITIPVSSISNYMFEDCVSLSSVTMKSVNSIDANAFRGCTSLTSITLPDSVVSIDEGAFYGCVNLSSITIPEGVTSIDYKTFYGCASLSSITLPESVTNIDSAAFYGCSRLSTVHYAGTEAQRANIEIGEENTNLTDATWHYECDGTDIAPPETPPTENPFVDVPEDAYYAEPVLWAVEKGVTNGLSADTFGPDATCTRAQIVTFLWRANGSPAPTSANNPFTDVPAGQWYTDAVLWAVEKGITAGTSATTFSPDAGCTRGQVATFLWRAEGESATNGSNIFADIAPGAYYYDAVLWAVENSITNGMGDGTFAPDATCTRAQIVTFLYRAMV